MTKPKKRPRINLKAKAWDKAADNLAEEVVWQKVHYWAHFAGSEWEHVETAVIPSLRRRAEIIRRRKS